MTAAEDLKSKLLFSVVVVSASNTSATCTRRSPLFSQLAFRHAQIQAKEVRNKVKQVLQLSNDKNSTALEETIEKYLRSTIQKYDVGKIAFVSRRIERVAVGIVRLF